MRWPNRSSILVATLPPSPCSIKAADRLTQQYAALSFSMKGQIVLRVVTVAVATCALVLTGCSTTETRIAEHPDLFQQLSARDQALVREGRIRDGMPMNGVWLAWGAPDQKGTGFARGRSVETWIYNEYYYAHSPYPYPYGPFGYGGYLGG